MSQSAVYFIRNLLSAASNTPLYGLGHPHVRHLLDLAAVSLQKALGSKNEMVIDVIGNEIIIDSRPQPYNLYLSRCAALLSSRGVGRLRFTKGVSLQELTSLITGLSLPPEKGGRLVSSENLKLGRIDGGIIGNTQEGDGADGNGNAAARLSLQELTRQDMATFMEIYEAVRRRKKFRITGLFNMVSGFVEVCRGGGKPPVVLTALGEIDEYSFTHSANVAILTIAQAMALGVDGNLLREIGVAAMLHDIGKLFVPEEILSKKGKLTDEEFAIMRDHPVRGARYLLDIPDVPRLAVLTALEHHMKYNRTGYPAVSPDWNINSCSHMTMISDFFDALRTHRSYREPMELRTIKGIMFDVINTELHPFFTHNFLLIMAKQDNA